MTSLRGGCMDTYWKARRDFLKSSIATATSAWMWSRATRAAAQEPAPRPAGPPRIRFAAIGMNHGHIYGQTEAVIRGGGQLVSFYAKEPELAEAFRKRFPQAKLARSEQEI